MRSDPSKVDSSSFDVVLKVAERCNLACRYCYYYFQEYDGNRNPAFITDAVMDEFPRFMARSADELNVQQLNVALHGGEPLLMKKDRFEELCRKLREAVEPKVRLRIAMQTNGVLVDEEWIDLIAKYKIGVGVSLDGSRPQHNSLRVDHAGRGTYDACVKGLKLLQAAANQGRIQPVGVLAVIPNKDSDKALEHLIVDLGMQSPNLNFPRDGWDSPGLAAWNSSLASHRKMVRYALDNHVYPKFHYIRGLTDVLLNLQSDVAAQFSDRHTSQRHYIATVSSDGKVLCDDNLLANDPDLAETSLTIFGTSLRDLVESPTWLRLNAAVDHVPADCSDCEWYRSCRSGALYNRYSKQEGYLRKSAICETIKMIHEEIANYLVEHKAVTLADLSTRLSRPPTTSARDRLLTLTRRPTAATVPPTAREDAA
jgi:uncharacterized protein